MVKGNQVSNITSHSELKRYVQIIKETVTMNVKLT